MPIPPSLNGSQLRFAFNFDTIDEFRNDYEGIYIGRFEVTACPAAGG